MKIRHCNNGAHSILGANLRYLDSKYSLDCKQIVSKWLMMEPMNVVIKVNQIKEMIQMRDRRGVSFLNANECGDIINFLCLE